MQTRRLYVIGNITVLGTKVDVDRLNIVDKKIAVEKRYLSQPDIEHSFPEDAVLKVFQTEEDARKYAASGTEMMDRISATHPIFSVTVNAEALVGQKLKTEEVSANFNSSYYLLDRNKIAKVESATIDKIDRTSRGNYDPDVSTLNQMKDYTRLRFQFDGFVSVINKIPVQLGLSKSQQPYDTIWNDSKGGKKEKVEAVLGQFKTSWCCMRQRFTNEAETMLAHVKKKETTDEQLFPLIEKEMQDLKKEGVLDDPYGAALSTLLDKTAQHEDTAPDKRFKFS